MQPLGVLKEIDPRTIWPHEAQDFTPWLAEHIDQLSEVLGLDLEITEREGAVGSYTVDLVGRDLGSGNMVVIENQLERTDHSHLGQLLTYAAGLEASIVIWMSPQFTEEHRQALDWLNEITGEKLTGNSGLPTWPSSNPGPQASPGRPRACRKTGTT